MPDIVAFATSHTTTSAPTYEPASSVPTAIPHKHYSLHFNKQDPDEEIILVLKPHWITNVSWILTVVVLLTMPLFIPLFYPLLQQFTAYVPVQFSFTILLTYYLCVLLYAMTKLTTWFYNVFIITQKRIVDVDFSDVIYHDVAITKLEEVEDVHYSQAGVLPSLFDYGDVNIQTQADKANFEAVKVPDPAGAAHLIVKLTKKGGHDD